MEIIYNMEQLIRKQEDGEGGTFLRADEESFRLKDSHNFSSNYNKF